MAEITLRAALDFAADDSGSGIKLELLSGTLGNRESVPGLFGRGGVRVGY